MKQKSGFSLVELMLAITIGSLIMLTVFSLFRQSHMIFYRSEVTSQAITESRTSLELMVHTLERAKANAWRISSPDPEHPYSRVDFEIASDATKGSFYWEEGKLMAKLGAQEPKILASHVRLLTFTANMLDLSTLYITFHLTSFIPGSAPYSILIVNREVHLRG